MHVFPGTPGSGKRSEKHIQTATYRPRHTRLLNTPRAPSGPERICWAHGCPGLPRQVLRSEEQLAPPWPAPGSGGARGVPGGVPGGPWGPSGGVLDRSWGQMGLRGPPGQSPSPHFGPLGPPKAPPGPPKIDPWDPKKVTTSTRILHLFTSEAMSKQGSKMGWL